MERTLNKNDFTPIEGHEGFFRNVNSGEIIYQEELDDQYEEHTYYIADENFNIKNEIGFCSIYEFDLDSRFNTSTTFTFDDQIPHT